jgi:hypothetical protein
MLENIAYYGRDTTAAKFKDISCQLPALLLNISATTREHWWMNWTQMGMHNKSENGRSAWDALYDTIP